MERERDLREVCAENYLLVARGRGDALIEPAVLCLGSRFPGSCCTATTIKSCPTRTPVRCPPQPRPPEMSDGRGVAQRCAYSVNT